MRGNRRDAPEDVVEFVDSDPRAFGRQREPVAAGPSPHRRWPVLAVVAAIALGGVAFAWWPGSNTPTADTPTTIPITAPSGRSAPGVVVDGPFTLVVQPAVVPQAGTVTMQLTGDLSTVTDRIAAIAWLDREVNGTWRTAYWLARSSEFEQQVRGASGDRAEAGPDAITVAADAAVSFTADVAVGEYRMCRYVATRGDATAGGTSPLAYVCAPLTVVG